MLKRVASISVVAGLLAGVSNCSSPGEPGYFGPGEQEDAGAFDAGGERDADTSPSSGGQNSAPTDAGQAGAFAEPSEPESNGGSSGGAGSEPGVGGSGGNGSVIDPNYGESIVIDDGVLHLWTLGDSITVGVEGGFRNDIYNLLTGDGWNVDMVGTEFDDSAEIEDGDHEGHTAYTFQLSREDADSWLAAIPTPDVVLMLLGSNDFAWWTNEQPPQHLEYAMDLIDHVLEQLPAAGLIVATLPPQSPEIVEDVHRDRNEMVTEFNELLRAEVPQHALYGKRLFVAEVGAKLELSELYDGIHPDREAHRKVADAWHEVLTQILPTARE